MGNQECEGTDRSYRELALEEKKHSVICHERV
jgi:hypothetical protein